MTTFRRWFEAGFTDVIPVIPPGARLSEGSRIPEASIGKTPGIKDGDTWHGFDWMRHPTDLGDTAAWGTMGASIGLRCGSVVGIDIDVLDEHLAEVIRAIAERVLGGAPARTGRAPKLLLVYRLAAGQAALTRKRLWFSGPDGRQHLIEFLGHGQQFVVDGIHPNTGRPYSWDQHPAELGLGALTPVAKDQVEQFFAQAAEVLEMLGCERIESEGSGADATDRAGIDQGGLLGPDIDKVAAAVALTPNSNDQFPGRTDYIRMGCAIKAACAADPARGRDIFLEWALRWEGNDRSPCNDEETVLADWERMKPPFEVGWNYIRDMAGDHGFDTAGEEFTALPQIVPGSGAEAEGPRYAPLPQDIPEDFDPRQLPRRPWTLGVRFMCGVVTGGIGAPGVSKSTMSLLSGIAIATGRELTGEPVHRQGKVWIHNNEDDPTEMLRRLAGICLHYGIDFAELRGRVKFSSGVVRRLRVAVKTKDGVCISKAVDEIIALIRAEEIVYWAVDPFISTHDGTEENSNEDIEKVVMCFRRIAAETGCAVDLVHHAVKNHSGNTESRAGDMNAARGASAFIGAIRIAYTLAPMSEQSAEDLGLDMKMAARLVRMDHAKGNYSGRVFEPRWFELLSVDLGNGPSEAEQDFGGVEGDLLAPSDSVGVPVLTDLGAITAAGRQARAADTDERAEQAFLDALDRLVAEGRAMSDKPRAGNYAPKMIVRLPEGEGLTVSSLERAMEKLFACNVLEVGSIGRNKRRQPMEGIRRVSAKDDRLPGEFLRDMAERRR